MTIRPSDVLVVVPAILPLQSTTAAFASHDRPVLLVDNSPDGEYARRYDQSGTYEVVRPPANLGVARSWNLGLARDAPLCLIVSQSVIFANGLAAAVRELADAADEYGVLTTLAFHVHGWTPAAVRRVGVFDENYFPGWGEDVDWVRRLHLSGVHDSDPAARRLPKVELAGAHSEFARTRRWMNDLGGYDHALQSRYHVAKWGAGLGYDAVYDRPFDDPARDWTWTPPAPPPAVQMRAHTWAVNRTPFAERAAAFGTDKYDHGYMPRYEAHLGGLTNADTPWTLAEVGVWHGASLRLWADVFPAARIVGVDIAPEFMFSEGRIATRLGDLRDDATLDGLASPHAPLRVVIDDGSHKADDVVHAFQRLWPQVEPGGWYVIEDLDVAFEPDWGGSPDGSTSSRLVTAAVGRCIKSAKRAARAFSEVHVYEEIAFLRKAAP